MPKKPAPFKTRTSAKQKLEDYKFKAQEFINKLRNPEKTSAFSVRGYEVLQQGSKKPNVISVPELLAIVGTARQLGRRVEISISDSGDNARLNFTYVAELPAIPSELF
jgi:hypothetical protein